MYLQDNGGEMKKEMKREMILQPSLEEAVLKCITEDAIITSDKLGESENIHYCNGAIYYEDGCRIGKYVREGIHILREQDWTKDAKWYVIGYFSKKQKKMLKELHDSVNAYNRIRFEDKFNKILALED